MFVTEQNGTIYVPRPEWHFDINEDHDVFTLKPIIDEMSRKAWAIEEEMLTGVVVDLLRERGYIVVAPEEN